VVTKLVKSEVIREKRGVKRGSMAPGESWEEVKRQKSWHSICDYAYKSPQFSVFSLVTILSYLL
jgi:hypothetical protein